MDLSPTLGSTLGSRGSVLPQIARLHGVRTRRAQGCLHVAALTGAAGEVAAHGPRTAPGGAAGHHEPLAAGQLDGLWGDGADGRAVHREARVSRSGGAEVAVEVDAKAVVVALARSSWKAN